MKIVNFKKISEMLGFDGMFAALHPIAKLRHFFVKNWSNSPLKHSTGN